MRHTSCTVGMDPNTSDDLPQGKLVHLEHARPVLLPGPAGTWAARGNPDGHRGFLRGPLLSAAGPIFHLVANGFRPRGSLGCVATEGARGVLQRPEPHFHLTGQA